MQYYTKVAKRAVKTQRRIKEETLNGNEDQAFHKGHREGICRTHFMDPGKALLHMCDKVPFLPLRLLQEMVS